MRNGIPLGHEPGAAAARVMPIFVHGAFGIIAQEDIVEPLIHHCRISRSRPLDRGISKSGEFLGRPDAAMRTFDQHGWPPGDCLRFRPAWRPNPMPAGDAQTLAVTLS